MPAKGPQGNKDQLMIAFELSQGLSNKEVAEKLGKPLVTVQKLKKKMNDGWKPDLSEAAIAAALPSPGKMMSGSSGTKVSHGGTPGKDDSGNGAEPQEKVPYKATPGFISLAAIQIKSQYTPIMYMARLAAEDKWGWPADLAFEDFIDTCLTHFFKDRGIILQGYIVEDEIGGDNDAEIKILKEQVKEMQEAMAGATP